MVGTKEMPELHVDNWTTQSTMQYQYGPVILTHHLQVCLAEVHALAEVLKKKESETLNAQMMTGVSCNAVSQTKQIENVETIMQE